MEVNFKKRYVNKINITRTRNHIINITNELNNKLYRRTYSS